MSSVSESAARTPSNRPALRRRGSRSLIARLAGLLAAGLPTGEALAIGATAGGSEAAAFAHLAAAVERGQTLSIALARLGCQLSDAEIAVVAAGERSGNLRRALGLLDSHLQAQAEQRQQLVQALLYPCALLTTTLAVTVLVAALVVPAFASMYAELDGELPLVTRCVVAVGDSLRAYGAACFAAVFAGSAALASTRRRGSRAGHLLDHCLIETPLVGRVVRMGARVQLYGIVAALLEAGLDVERALELATPSLANRAARRHCVRMRRMLRGGTKLSDALARSGLDRVGHDASLLRVAEATGNYEACFKRLAAVAGDERNTLLLRATRLAEPLAVTLVAVVVAATVLAVYQPLLGSAGLLTGAPR
jgi:type II secretory pathway component PulF